MKTTKKERNENAKNFYSSFMNSYRSKAAIIVLRKESKNTNIVKTQFLASPSTTFSNDNPMIIAESKLGIDGCFMEFLSAINLQPTTDIKSYWESDFEPWIAQNYKFRISYRDKMVLLLEKCQQ